jgi:secreted Zn-dependent insulinase-like peptidase
MEYLIRRVVSTVKKILHQKFVIGELTREQQHNLHEHLKIAVDSNELEYIVITTPTDLSVLEDDQAVISIDAKDYTLQELLEAIEKAAQYDDLCK